MFRLHAVLIGLLMFTHWFLTICKPVATMSERSFRFIITRSLGSITPL